jgi:hypothetical protein
MKPNPIISLFHSRKFLLAVVALAQTVLFQFVPSFPPAVWQAIDGVLVILIVSIAAEDVAEKANG